MLDVIHDISKTFFSKLWILFTDLQVTVENNGLFTISLKSSESGVLIWNHWQNLESIAKVLRILIVKNVWEKVNINIEVNDYLKSKEDRLLSLVKFKIDLINKSGNEIVMPFLSPYERKKVHSIVSDLWWWRIYTKSIWEWKDRKLHIYKVDKRITLDIDSNDI